MRGKNIRLRHQEHVRSAMSAPRQAQSASGPLVKNNEAHRGTINSSFFRSKYFKEKYEQSVAVASERNSAKSTFAIAAQRPTYSRIASSFALGGRARLAREKTKSPPATAPVCQLSKSIVIKIPQLTEAYH